MCLTYIVVLLMICDVFGVIAFTEKKIHFLVKQQFSQFAVRQIAAVPPDCHQRELSHHVFTVCERDKVYVGILFFFIIFYLLQKLF